MNAEIKTEGLTGHPAKLYDGAWGAHVNSDKVKEGDTVHLTTKAKKEWDAVVEKVVWTGVDSDGVPCALVSLVGKTAPTASAPAAAGKPAAKPAAAAATSSADGQTDF